MTRDDRIGHIRSPRIENAASGTKDLPRLGHVYDHRCQL